MFSAKPAIVADPYSFVNFGLSDEYSLGTYTNIDGTTPGFTDWMPNEPSYGSEHFTGLYKDVRA